MYQPRIARAWSDQLAFAPAKGCQPHTLSFSPAIHVHCKKILRDSWIIFDQTFQGLGLGTLFPARESLVSDIPAGDGKSINLYLQCTVHCTVYFHIQVMNIVYVIICSLKELYICAKIISVKDHFSSDHVDKPLETTLVSNTCYTV